MNTEDASLNEYRRAVQVYPQLNVTPTADPAAETRLATPGSAGARAATGDAEAGEHAASPPSVFPLEYEVRGKLAETRLSRTWKVFHRDTKVCMVLKEPLAAVALDPDAMDRFRLEVQLIARLRHPNIVPISATHLHQPPYFYAMPFVEGVHLDEYCARHALSLNQRLELFLKICRAVAHAHQHGVLHRDLKPLNILVDEDGQPQILDFGLGRILDQQSSGADIPGPVMGTPAYMAPEQAAGLPGDTRTDIYALGVILYSLVTGTLPIEPVADLGELCRRIQVEVPLPPRQRAPQISRELEAIITRALAKRPDERYAGAADLANDIDNLRSHRPVEALPAGAWYRLHRWAHRNAIAVGVGTFVTTGVLGFTVFAALLWHWQQVGVESAKAVEAESGRHRLAVLNGRNMVRAGDPVNAARTLWSEFLQYDTPLTRGALWELYRRYPCVLSISVQQPGAMPVDIEYSPDGRYLVTAWSDGAVEVHATNNGQRTERIELGDDGVTAIKFLPGEMTFVGGGARGGLRLWTLDSDGRIAMPPGSLIWQGPATIRALAVSRSGHLMAVGIERSVYVLSRPDGWRILRVWEVYDQPVSALAFSEDEGKLAAGTLGAEEGTAGVVSRIATWNLTATEVEWRIKRTDHVRAVRFTPDGNQLLTAAENVELCALDGSETHALGEPGHWGVRSLDLSPDPEQRFLAYASGDGAIRLFDRSTQARLDTGGYHAAAASDVHVCFSPDGHCLASAGPDGVRVWRVPPLDGSVRAAPAGYRLEQPDLPGEGADLLAGYVDPAANSRGFIVWSEKVPAPQSLIADTIDSTARFSPDGEFIALVSAQSGSRREIVLRHVGVTSTEVLRDALPDGDSQYACWVNARVLALASTRATPEPNRPGRGCLQLWTWNEAGGHSTTLGEFASPCNYVTAGGDGEWLVVCAEGSANIEPPIPGEVLIYTRLATTTGAFSPGYRLKWTFQVSPPSGLPRSC
jgi:WD40 repeat protein